MPPFPSWWSFDALEVLRGALAEPEAASALRGSVLLRSPEGAVRLTLGGRGVTAAAVPRDSSADVQISAPASCLHALVRGEGSGVRAYLDGTLELAGNIALTLRVDALFGDHGDELRLTTGVVHTSAPAVAPEDPLGRLARLVRRESSTLATSYLEAGDREAPTAVLLHGLGATSASFLPTVAALAREHHVIVPDLPGFGESSKPLVSYHPRFFSAWLDEFLKQLRQERVALVGNSMGGRIALEFALDAPERVTAVALLTPSLAWRRRRQLAPLVRLLRHELGVALPIFSRPAARWVLGQMFADANSVPASWREAGLDEFLRIVSEPRGRIAFLSAARQVYLEEPRSFWTRLADLSPPALFVFGAQDRVVPARFARHVARLLPSATVVTLADCGHIPQFEKPQETHTVLREFLARSAISVAPA